VGDLAARQGARTALDEAFVVVSPDGQLGGWNQRFVDLWGLAADVLATRSAEDVFLRAAERAWDPTRFLALLRVPLGAGVGVEGNVVLADGRTVEARGTVLAGPGPRPGRLWRFREAARLVPAPAPADPWPRCGGRPAVCSRDLASLWGAMDRANYTIVTTDGDGRIRTFNPAAARLLGYTPGEVVDRANVVLFHDERELRARAEQLSRELERPVAPGFEVLAAPARSGETDERDWTFVTRGQSRIPVLLAVTPLKGDEGQVTGFLHVGHDVTRSKEVERLKNDFVSTVSHELRTPLAAIRGSLGLLEGGVLGELPGQAIEVLRIARTASDRLIRLINDLLDLDKMDAGKHLLHLEDTEAPPLVQVTLEQLHAVAHKAGVKLFSWVKGPQRVHVDPDRIVQVLTNLVSNAVAFSRRGGEVRVRVEPGKPGFLRFSVTDHGVGIPHESLGRLFGRFEQIDDTEAPARSGTGLGLAISKAIIQQHRGEIGVDSQVGIGSTFWFEVPLADGHGVAPGAHQAHVLLVAGDEKLSRELGGAVVHAGYALVRATAARSAERLIAREPPAAIIVDLDSVPQGLDLLAARRGGEAPSAARVALGGAACPDGLSGPGTSWLHKPVEGPVLVAALRRLVADAAPHVLVVDDDPSVRMVVASQLRSCGIVCTEAASGAEALRLARADPPGLIVLDVGMPGMDGYQVVAALQRRHLGEVPLVVYSGRELGARDRAALTLGPTRHLLKARSSERELVGAVRELLGGRAEAHR